MKALLAVATALVTSGCAPGVVARSPRTDIAVVTANYRQPAGLHWELRLGEGQQFRPVIVDGADRWCSVTHAYFPDMWIMAGPQHVCLRDTTGRGRFDKVYLQFPRPFRRDPDYDVNVPYILVQNP